MPDDFRLLSRRREPAQLLITAHRDLLTNGDEVSLRYELRNDLGECLIFGQTTLLKGEVFGLRNVLKRLGGLFSDGAMPSHFQREWRDCTALLHDQLGGTELVR